MSGNLYSKDVKMSKMIPVKCQNGCKGAEAKTYYAYRKEYKFCLLCLQKFAQRLTNEIGFRDSLIKEYHDKEGSGTRKVMSWDTRPNKWR